MTTKSWTVLKSVRWPFQSAYVADVREPFSTEMASDSKPGDDVFVDVYAYSIPSKSSTSDVDLCRKMRNTDNVS